MASWQGGSMNSSYIRNKIFFISLQGKLTSFHSKEAKKKLKNDPKKPVTQKRRRWNFETKPQASLQIWDCSQRGEGHLETKMEIRIPTYRTWHTQRERCFCIYFFEKISSYRHERYLYKETEPDSFPLPFLHFMRCGFPKNFLSEIPLEYPDHPPLCQEKSHDHDHDSFAFLIPALSFPPFVGEIIAPLVVQGIGGGLYWG